MKDLRLPRTLRDEPAAEHLGSKLATRAVPLWEGGDVLAVGVELFDELNRALIDALACGRIVRGFEAAERALDASQLGLNHADQKSGATRGARVSRLVVLANDGSDRFYRNVQSMLLAHSPRVLALRVDTDENALGQLLFGPNGRARLLLVDHKAPVAEVLLALANRWATS